MILIRIIPFKQDALLKRRLSRGSVDRAPSSAARTPVSCKLLLHLLCSSSARFLINDQRPAATRHGPNRATSTHPSSTAHPVRFSSPVLLTWLGRVPLKVCDEWK